MAVSTLKIEELLEALKAFKDVKNGMSVNEMIIFLTAGKLDEPNIKTLAKWAGVTPMTTSRLVFSLSVGENRRKQDGLGLVERFEDPDNRLQTRVKLTDKGMELLEKVAGK